MTSGGVTTIVLDALRLERARDERPPLGRDDHHRARRRERRPRRPSSSSSGSASPPSNHAHDDVAPRRNRARGRRKSGTGPGGSVDAVRPLLAPVDEDAHDAVRAGRGRAARARARVSSGRRRVARGADDVEAHVAAAGRGRRDERAPSGARRARRTRRAARRAPSVNITTARSPARRVEKPEQRDGGIRIGREIAARRDAARRRARRPAPLPAVTRRGARAERDDARYEPLLARPGPHLFERLGARLRRDAARRVDEDVEARRRDASARVTTGPARTQTGSESSARPEQHGGEPRDRGAASSRPTADTNRSDERDREQPPEPLRMEELRGPRSRDHLINIALPKTARAPASNESANSTSIASSLPPERPPTSTDSGGWPERRTPLDAGLPSTEHGGLDGARKLAPVPPPSAPTRRGEPRELAVERVGDARARRARGCPSGRRGGRSGALARPEPAVTPEPDAGPRRRSAGSR